MASFQLQDISYRRTWLPTFAVGAGVSSPLSVLAYRQLPRDPVNAVRVDVERSYSLTLDKEWTTPQAIIGVKFGTSPSSRSDCVVLTPGETIPVPSGFTKFWVFAADNLDLIVSDVRSPLDTVCGYVSFLVGTTPGSLAPQQHSVHPKARIVAFRGDKASLPNPGATGLHFVPSNIRRVKLTAWTTDGAGFNTPVTQAMACSWPFGIWPVTRRGLSAFEVPKLNEETIESRDSTPSIVAEFMTSFEVPRYYVAANRDSFGVGSVILGPEGRVFTVVLDAIPGTANYVKAWEDDNYMAPAAGFGYYLEADDDAVNARDIILGRWGNAAVGTPVLRFPTIDIESFIIHMNVAGGVDAGTTITVTGRDAWAKTGTNGARATITRTYYTGAITPAVTDAVGCWGPGCTYSTNGFPAIAAPLPQFVEISLSAFAVGIPDIVVYGKRKVT